MYECWGSATLLYDLADVTLPAPRLGPDLLLQTMRPKPHLDRLNEQVMHLHILIEGVTLQRLRGVWMEIEHEMGGGFFERAPPAPLNAPLWERHRLGCGSGSSMAVVHAQRTPAYETIDFFAMVRPSFAVVTIARPPRARQRPCWLAPSPAR